MRSPRSSAPDIESNSTLTTSSALPLGSFWVSDRRSMSSLFVIGIGVPLRTLAPTAGRALRRRFDTGSTHGSTRAGSSPAGRIGQFVRAQPAGELLREARRIGGQLG